MADVSGYQALWIGIINVLAGSLIFLSYFRSSLSLSLSPRWKERMETPPLPCSASRREIAAWNFPRFAPCFYPVSLLESREIRSWNKGALSRAKVGNIVFVRCSNARGKLEKLSTIFVRVLERWDISTRNTVSFVNWNGRKKISLRSWCEDLSQDEITVEFSMRLSKIYPWPTTFLFPLLFLIERNRQSARDNYSCNNRILINIEFHS